MHTINSVLVGAVYCTSIDSRKAQERELANTMTIGERWECWGTPATTACFQKQESKSDNIKKRAKTWYQTITNIHQSGRSFPAKSNKRLDVRTNRARGKRAPAVQGRFTIKGKNPEAERSDTRGHSEQESKLTNKKGSMPLAGEG